MGLDMYLFATDRKLPKKFSAEEDDVTEYVRDRWFPHPKSAQEEDSWQAHDAEQIHYWRKHRHLMGLLETIYQEAGGTDSFNCIFLRLDDADIARIRHAVTHQQFVGRSEGFFWGEGDASERLSEDLKALKAIEEAQKVGKSIFFRSSW